MGGEFSTLVTAIVAALGTQGLVKAVELWGTRRQRAADVETQLSGGWEKLADRLDRRVRALEDELEQLRQEVRKLERENASLRIQNAALRDENADLRKRVDKLRTRVTQIESNGH